MFRKRLLVVFVGLVLILCGCNMAAVESNEQTEKGIRLYEQKAYPKALQVLQMASERDPNNDLPLYYMALIDMEYFHDYGKAIQELQQATGILADSALYWHKLGEAYYGLAEQQMLNRQKEDAGASFTACIRSEHEATKIDKYYAEAQLQEARCHVGLEDFDRAVEAYEASIRSDPTLKSSDNVTVHYKELAELYADFGFQGRAVSVLTNGLAINMNDGQLEVVLGDVLADMERYDEALAHYEAAYRFLDESGESKLYTLSAMFGAAKVNYDLARQMRARGEFRKAFDYYSEARTWFTRYADRAVTEAEKIRRAGALLKIKEINEIMKEENI
ncbi:MAG: tetratricopeptide repeat protein [Proteobacteria bacterium]|nr:tetratricopeptide repeat protein [Pseudomonadota bacterium]